MRYLLLPSSKSPSALLGHWTVPFLPASRSISTWGETNSLRSRGTRPSSGVQPASPQPATEGCKPGTRSRGRGARGGGRAVGVSGAAALGSPAAARSAGPDSPRTSRSLSEPRGARGVAAAGPGLCSPELRPRPLRARRPRDASRCRRGQSAGLRGSPLHPSGSLCRPGAGEGPRAPRPPQPTRARRQPLPGRAGFVR